MDVRRVIPPSAEMRRGLATAIRDEAEVLKDILVLVPLAHQPVLESQGSAAFELKISREYRASLFGYSSILDCCFGIALLSIDFREEKELSLRKV